MGRRRNGAEPEMRFHAHSGQARVRINGKVIYLGPWDSPEAKSAYHRIVAEWHATGTVTAAQPKAANARAAPRAPRASSRQTEPPAAPAGLTLAVLAPYLKRAPHRFCFSPAESERERCWWRRRERKSPMTPSQSARRPKAQPMCKPGDHYRSSSLLCAIQRACRRANVPEWTTMQLRHNAGTEARDHLGLDAAQARLGHRQANVTQVYAAVTDRRKREVARLLG